MEQIPEREKSRRALVAALEKEIAIAMARLATLESQGYPAETAARRQALDRVKKAKERVAMWRDLLLHAPAAPAVKADVKTSPAPRLVVVTEAASRFGYWGEAPQFGF